MEQDTVHDRLSISLTILLTAVAFKFQISQDTPNCARSTHLDQASQRLLRAAPCLERGLACLLLCCGALA